MLVGPLLLKEDIATVWEIPELYSERLIREKMIIISPLNEKKANDGDETVLYKFRYLLGSILFCERGT
jgi:hypothetical protein